MAGGAGMILGNPQSAPSFVPLFHAFLCSPSSTERSAGTDSKSAIFQADGVVQMPLSAVAVGGGSRWSWSLVAASPMTGVFDLDGMQKLERAGINQT